MDIDVAKNLRVLFAEKQIVQADVAQRLSIEPSRLSRMLSGERKIDANEVPAIAEAIGVSLDRVYGIQESRLNLPSSDTPIQQVLREIGEQIGDDPDALSELRKVARSRALQRRQRLQALRQLAWLCEMIAEMQPNEVPENQGAGGA